jgi:hypothetical protein
MDFNPSSIWTRFRARPKWLQILLFAFTILGIIAAVVWSVLRRAAQPCGNPDDSLEIVEDYFNESAEATQKKSDELDIDIEVEHDWRETLEEKQKRDHETAERTRDEIRNADSISDITNALRKGRGD